MYNDSQDLLQDRRNDYDVIDRVQVSSIASVRQAVREIYNDTYPGSSFDTVWLAFHDFQRLFEGGEPGYLGCDTVYHDTQHTLDMCLAMARLIAGHERINEPADRLGADRATVGLVTALFHDSGYIRHISDRGFFNGAEFTLYHVSRSAGYLETYLPRLSLEEAVPVATQIVHFTGYEMNLDQIELDDPKDSLLGHFLGTADLLAQMADRCYLEKCRDRLYPEFVLGGVAVFQDKQGATRVRYRSGLNLLEKTLAFYQNGARKRLIGNFNKAYRYLEAVFEGRNPYIEFIQKNLNHLLTVRKRRNWSLLRRKPACFTQYPNAVQNVKALAAQRLRALEMQQKIRIKRTASA